MTPSFPPGKNNLPTTYERMYVHVLTCVYSSADGRDRKYLDANLVYIAVCVCLWVATVQGWLGDFSRYILSTPTKVKERRTHWIFPYLRACVCHIGTYVRYVPVYMRCLSVSIKKLGRGDQL